MTNDLIVITPVELAAWSALVAVMTVTLIVLAVLAWRLRRSACRCRPVSCGVRGVEIEEMPGHPERVDVLPDPVEERAFGAIGDRLRADRGIARALHRCGWDE